MRRAISPRFAMRTFFIMFAALANNHQNFAELDGLAIGDEDVFDCARFVGLDRGKCLHGLDQNYRIAFFDAIADGDEGISIGAGA